MTTHLPGNAQADLPRSEESPALKPTVSWRDEDLVDLVLRGNRIAFACIVEKHRRWIYRLCARMLQSTDKADDTTQEVFARALEKMPMLNHGAKLVGWLKVIAVNQCLTVIEKEKLYRPLGDEEPARCTNLTPEQQVLASENRRLVGEFIDRLPPRQQLVFVMKYIDGYTYRQIRQLTGFSEKQVKSYLQNARRNFERAWTNRGKAG
ncbi:MAG TPA: sigma-70 family RNA polymerase sigma factor [Terriglobia bacterium]|nr:sigma-70 family RNA polymerase sigma factor [Terriglobia bacterium]